MAVDRSRSVLVQEEDSYVVEAEFEHMHARVRHYNKESISTRYIVRDFHKTH